MTGHKKILAILTELKNPKYKYLPSKLGSGDQGFCFKVEQIISQLKFKGLTQLPSL